MAKSVTETSAVTEPSAVTGSTTRHLAQASGDVNDHATRGRWLIIAAAVLWSTSGIFAKAPFLDQWPPDERGVLLAFWRTFFAGLALLPFIGRPRWDWRLLPAGFSFAMMNATFLLAMTNTTAANAIWLQYTAPVWVLLAGVLWLGEIPTRRGLWMVFLGTLGVAVILAGEWLVQPQTGLHRIGTIWGLISGFGFAAVMISFRQLRALNGFFVASVCHLSAAAALAPWVISHPQRIDFGVGVWLAIFGVFQMAIPYVLFARGMRSVTGHEAACLTLLEPLLVPVWVFAVWGDSTSRETPSVWTWGGAILILAGLIIRYGSRPIRANLAKCQK